MHRQAGRFSAQVMSKPLLLFFVFALSVGLGNDTHAASAHKAQDGTCHKKTGERARRLHPCSKAAKKTAARSSRATPAKRASGSRNAVAKSSASRENRSIAPAVNQADSACAVPVAHLAAQTQSASGVFEHTAAPAVPLEGDGGENLRLFFSRLRQLETGETAERVRIMQIGDSHTAGDYFSHALRMAFQQRFADGGPGWLRPGGLKNYRSAQVEYQQSPAWQMIDSRIDKQRPFSLGGFMAVTDMADASLLYQLSGNRSPQPSIMELTWQGGPDAGRVAILADGNPVSQLQTGGEPSGWLNTRVPLQAMPHSLKLKTLDNKPVQLAGITLEYCHQGVVLDSIGTNGAQLSILARWDGEELRKQLARRNPSFVILGYGTNEAYDPRFTAAQLRQSLQQAARVLQTSLPHASVLLLGPPDSMRENDCGGETHQRLAIVRHVQRQVAEENRWLYWDWSALMGGNCGIARWEKQQLARADHVHMTPQGYVISAKALFDALMDRYRQFLGVNYERPLHKV